MSAADYVDEAAAALGGEDADFLIKGVKGLAGVHYSIELSCRPCGAIYSAGEMELWELVADARDHFEREHASRPDGEPRAAQPGGEEEAGSDVGQAREHGGTPG